jgi:CheY-like chemotaxis protein
VAHYKQFIRVSNEMVNHRMYQFPYSTSFEAHSNRCRFPDITVNAVGLVMQNAGAEVDFAEGNASPSDRGLRLISPAALPRQEGRLCVLLVEDDEADVYLIKRALAKNPRVGEVVVARDGVEALELIVTAATEPDLAIVDLHMPRKDGLALLREFASEDSFQFPSVVLTSSRAGADALRAKKRGAMAYVVKPNSAAKLRTALDEVIARI